MIVIISTSDNHDLIAEAAEKLALETRQILREFQKTLLSEQTAQGVFDSSYPEIRDGIRKVLTTCERQQTVAASVAAWFAQYDLSLMLNSLQSSANHSNFNLYREFAILYRQLGFPDLMQSSSGELFQLAGQARLLDEKVREWLCEQAVDLREFATFEEFERMV
jgi:hypothetical protein